MRRTGLVWVAALVAVLAVAVGVTRAPAAGDRRKIFMSAVEYKGGALVTEEAYPPADEPGTRPLSPLGGGYRLKPPDTSGRWEVSSYRFEPGLLVAEKGERIVLEIAGINGARHDVHLVSPSGEMAPLVVTRGRLTRVRFRADEVGIWLLHCETHPPGMVAEIVVMP